MKCKAVKRVLVGPATTGTEGKQMDFFSFHQSGIADEVSWDFIARVVNSKTSFTFFYKDLPRIYHTNNPDAKAFLSQLLCILVFCMAYCPWLAWLAVGGTQV